MLLTGAQIIMECLLEQKVDTVFGYPGGAVLNIYDALYEYSDRINHILTAHEQGAAHAADGYARSSGKTGVCIATSGPGATNLVTGIATAYMDSVPMVAITGNVNRDLLGLDSFQEVDITGITMPITKHNYIVKRVEDLADTIREAFFIANEGRKGPVLIDIPKDVTGAKFEYIPKETKAKDSRPLPPKEWMDRAAELLKNSKRPLIYAGGGVLLSNAAPELKKLAEQLDAPVSCSLMCQGGFDQTDERYIGMMGMHGTKTASLAIAGCDLLVAVGTRFSDRVTCNTSLFATHCPILQIDIDPAEFNKNVDVEIRLSGDAKAVLQALLPMFPQMEHKTWMESIGGWKAEFPLIQHTDSENGVTPQMVLEKLSELTQSEAILTTEVGQHQMWAAQFYDFKHPRQFITSGGLGTMGFGLGASIGAQVANPDKQVINIAGDGSFHMNANELSTAAKYNIPIIELLFNNEVLGMVRQWQKLFYDGRFSQTTLEKKTDYEKLAEAYGVTAMTIAAKDDIEPVLRAALAEQGPVFINCIIDRDLNVLPMVPAGASVEEPMLEIDWKA
ncbi:biosynthetic-type acetolactate synthase large subunit [Fumia xinanensis]|uniref:Acetolactate synthase n=1 Tax=Fumia xinanensis TaxID=2763659 RepID=A0A926E2N8_9FIRM|nr:biosynthetic-type acetolactate synthase large subunit [Fumia xinanensis]MBC8559932.1 biosynthetic-type acetolactate synthase large subunit [Fumia xinanensis]